MLEQGSTPSVPLELADGDEGLLGDGGGDSQCSAVFSLNPNSPWEPRGLPPLYLLRGAGGGDPAAPAGNRPAGSWKTRQEASLVTLCREQRSYGTKQGRGLRFKLSPQPRLPRAWCSPHPHMPPPPSSQQASLGAFELVQSLLGHTTWLTKAMGNSTEGTVCWFRSFYPNGDKTLSRRTAHLPPPPRQTEGKTVTTWLGPVPRTHDSVAWTRLGGNLGTPDSSGGWDGRKPLRCPWEEESRQCLLVIIHFTRGLCPQGRAAEAHKACQMA